MLDKYLSTISLNWTQLHRARQNIILNATSILAALSIELVHIQLPSIKMIYLFFLWYGIFLLIGSLISKLTKLRAASDSMNLKLKKRVMEVGRKNYELGVLKNDLSSALDALEKISNELAEESYISQLTGLKNKFALKHDLGNLYKIAKRDDKWIAVTFLDLNKFKSINDTLGHEAGDCLLKRFANLLKKNTRETDFCYHLSGDEFIMIIIANTKYGCESVIEKLRRKIAHIPFSFNGQKVVLSAKIGFSIKKVSDISMEEIYTMIHDADAQMIKKAYF